MAGFGGDNHRGEMNMEPANAPERKRKRIYTKPPIFGFHVNFQGCNRNQTCSMRNAFQFMALFFIPTCAI